MGGRPELEERSSLHTATAVWRLRGPHGQALYLKRPSTAAAFRRERRAYLEWLPRLTDALSTPEVVWPRLVGCSEPPTPALLLTALDGQPLAGEPSPIEAHELAGRFLAALHALPYCDRDLDLLSAYRKRLAGSRRQAQDLALEAALEPVFVHLEEHLPELEGESRVLCHRDFTPRNWLWQREGQRLGVIDFEHAQADFRWSDVERLAAGVWSGQAGSEAAFWRGYGGAPSEPQRRLIQALAAFSTCRQILWAASRGPSASHWAERGWSTLGRLGWSVEPGQ